MDIKNSTAPCICCYTTLWNINIRVHLANTLLKDEESARDNHVFAGNFAKYLPI